MLLAALLLIVSSPDRPRLPPVDTCASAPGFAAFREKLLDVIARRDVPGLLALTDENVQLSFGGDGGHADMKRIWDLDHPSQSRIWPKLGEALGLGCVMTEERIAVAPSMAHSLPDRFDAFDSVVVVKRAILRTAPNTTAPAIGTLDWDIVTAVDGINPDGWTRIRTQSGHIGFVRSSTVRSPIDYRALFERRDGAWRMTAFVAGD